MFGTGGDARLWESKTARRPITARRNADPMTIACASFSFFLRSFRKMRYKSTPAYEGRRREGCQIIRGR